MVVPARERSSPGAVTGLLLAAGEGLRFDPHGERLKLLAALPGDASATALAVRAARALRCCLEHVVAVVPAGTDPRHGELAALLRAEGCTLVACDATGAERGTGASIAAGVAASADAGGWLVALADMPCIQPATVAAVRDAIAAGAASAAPCYRGRRGHPVGFGAACGPRLRALRGDRGAREVLRDWPPLHIEVDDPGILQDIDVPGDLEGAGVTAASGLSGLSS